MAADGVTGSEPDDVPPAGTGGTMRARTAPLFELAAVFLKLGTIAFGGPAAHVALMEEEFVRRRRWLSSAEFIDLVGATNLIPGPNSTELAIHIGRARAGWAGLFVAGACFILPAAILVAAIASAYVTFGQLPVAIGVFAGIKPVIIAVVGQALLALGRVALKTRTLGVIGLGAAMASWLGVHELAILSAAGLLAVLVVRRREDAPPSSRHNGSDAVSNGVAPFSTLLGKAAFGLSAAGGVVAFSMWTLFAAFVKVGALLFGSGYVLLAFLRSDFVERLGWLSERQLLDAVAVGQVTPGPVFTTATFVGYVMGGGWGAVVATVGIFLPAFIFVAISAPLIPRLRRSAIAGAVLDGVNVASLGLMAAVTVQLSRAALTDLVSATLALASAVLLFRYRVNSVWLVVGGALVGLVRTWLFA